MSHTPLDGASAGERPVDDAHGGPLGLRGGPGLIVAPAGGAIAGAVVAPRRADGQHLARRRSRRTPAGRSLALNLTALLDCVFMLLLFLIVATRFARPEGLLPARMPGRAAAGPGFEVPRTPVRLYLSADPARRGASVVRVEDAEGPIVPRAELIARLRAIHDRPGNDERTPVHLAIDGDVGWDDVVNAYNAALAASFERIYFARG